MKQQPLITLVLFLLASPIGAQDYDTAVAANERGDYITALKHLTPLAENGFAEAQALLGAMYAQGRGMPPDPAEAIRWFRKGIEQGNHWAQHNLGFMYAQGQGVLQNDYEAAKWFRKAANQGNADAQSNLGVMYSTGRGVPRDFLLAYIWLSVASANGAKFASENRKIITERLTKDELKKARAISNRCFKNPNNCPNSIY